MKDLTVEQMDQLDKYSAHFTASVRRALRASLTGDILTGKYESYIGKKISIENLQTLMENPTTAAYQKQLRQMSMYLFFVYVSFLGVSALSAADFVLLHSPNIQLYHCSGKARAEKAE